jgi:hypothetical protein
MPNRPRSNDELLTGPQPQLDSEDIDLEAFEDLEDLGDTPIDDPGEAQRSSKSEPDGDGEEEMR